MKKVNLLIIVLFVTIASIAQNPTYYLNPNKKLSQNAINKLTTENGLSTNSLLHIYQARNGSLHI
nr:hypothetical protein [Prolixibacteraceae bacterium]